MKAQYVLLFGIVGLSMNGITTEHLKKLLHSDSAGFGYDLGLKIFPGKHKESSVMICCHGYGANNQIGYCVYSSGIVQEHIVSFNFPDYDLHRRPYDPKKSSFGTFKELAPLLYLLKQCVIDGQQDTISLYGFSAGGAAVINLLGVLHHNAYDQQLNQMGIGPQEKKKIISAIQKGIIILDCPMKSVEEIMDIRGKSPEFEILAQQYLKNNMRPINVIDTLKTRANIILYFENPDEILGNRDDQLFIKRLKDANAGKTEVVIGSYGGHNTYHASLWNLYKKF